MKFRLKLPNEIATHLGVNAYVFEKEFDFSNALLRAIKTEGLYDEIDDQDTSLDDFDSDDADSSPSPAQSRSPSPLTSLPSSASPSRATTPSIPDATNKVASTDMNAKKRKLTRSKASSKKNRKRKRREAHKKVEDANAASASAARFVPSSAAIRADFSMFKDAPVASTSYVGLRDQGGVGEGRAWWLREVTGSQSRLNFTLVKAEPGTTVPFADEQGRVIGYAVYPNDPSIKSCVDEAAELLRKQGSKAKFNKKHRVHRRGNFRVLNTGITHGNGRLKPGMIVNNKTNTKLLQELVQSTPFQRLSGFATGTFKTWAPKLYEYCADHFQKLLGSDSELRRIFPNSFMSAAAFNFGPRTVCLPHIDFSNLPFLWCFIWGMGNYDWRKGGHLILWDLKLVVEFPPGSLIAIPSGVLRHSNTHVGKNETRYSFTQYSSGGNFRWVDRGFMSEEDFMRSQSTKERIEEEVRKRERWQMGLDLFSTLAELGLQ